MISVQLSGYSKYFHAKEWIVLQRCEDTQLELQPLPTMKLVQTPDRIPNELFGDVIMVTEFISCYRGLLMPDDSTPITSGL